MEALRNRPTGNVNRLDEVEGQCQGGSFEARINHLQTELEDMIWLRQVGKYSGRHKGNGEMEQCQRCTYEKHEAGQKCPAEERTCKTCGERGQFVMSKLRKKKAARRVKEEQKDTTSEDSDIEDKKEVNRVVRDQVWPGTSDKAKRRSFMHITEERGAQGDDIAVDSHFERTREEVRRIKGGGKKKSRW